MKFSTNVSDQLLQFVELQELLARHEVKHSIENLGGDIVGLIVNPGQEWPAQWVVTFEDTEWVLGWYPQGFDVADDDTSYFEIPTEDWRLVAAIVHSPMHSEFAVRAVTLGVTEIREDVDAGTVPATVLNFSELHDYVDANGYGGLFDVAWEVLSKNPEGELDVDLVNSIQFALDRWIKYDGVKATA